MGMITFPEDRSYRNSGIRIQYIKSRDVLYIDGFYDDFVGIEGTEISVKDFAERLGIDLKRNRK
jgi:hypothetical protein